MYIGHENSIRWCHLLTEQSHFPRDSNIRDSRERKKWPKKEILESLPYFPRA